MPSSTRKRGAPLGNGTPSSSKKSRTASTKAATQSIEPNADTEDTDSDKASPVESGDMPIKKPKKAAALANRRKKSDDRIGPVEIASTKTVAVTATSVTAEILKISADPVNSPRPKSRKRVKTEPVKEEEEEERILIEQANPKKTKKRKVAKEEDGIAEEQIDGEVTAPKKPKRKRKIQEEKEAEAMPLAARTTGLRMFFGAHVSGAKGAFSKLGRRPYIERIENLTFVLKSFVLSRCAKCRNQLCPNRVYGPPDYILYSLV